MSKGSVPEAYAKIIKDVCESARADFEEAGVDLEALELLRKGWQKRLTDSKIGTFPWDPKPDPVARAAVNQTASPKPESLSVKPVPGLQNGVGSPALSGSSASTPQPHSHIKQEGRYGVHPQSLPSGFAGQGMPMYNSEQLSAERAAQAMEQKFGHAAASQVNQLRQQNQYLKQEPQVKQESYDQAYGQYNGSLQASQNDGAGDLEQQYNTKTISRRKDVAQHGQRNKHSTMRDRLKANEISLQAGGLLMPLSQQPSSKAQARMLVTNHQSNMQRAQGDANGDEDDEDAINSDLDDPEDAIPDDDEEDTSGNVMYCTYDKVQRVKNKWKCTLKDGVMKIDGAEYVFHKGQGEFEW